jgi:signal transduction histidine kinase
MPVNPFETVSRPPIAASLLSLAPLRLPNRRGSRYVGDDVFVSLEDVAETDRILLERLYSTLTELLQAIADPTTDDDGKWRGVVQWKQRHDLTELITDVRELGVASRTRGFVNEGLAKAMHDVRGGALSALLGRLDLLDRSKRDVEHMKTLFVLARDHLKIMRNAIVGLDEPRRQADRTPKSHAMALMLEKWHDSVVGPKWSERPIRMNVDCRYDGMLTECCLESAAIDRIFYNLANNACRHAAGDRIEMDIFPIPDPTGDCLRFVLSNEVTESDAAHLSSLFEHSAVDDATQTARATFPALFEPEVSSTGSGFGLTVVAEFVAGAFGLRSRAEALRERYVGAVLDDRTFRAWFHWPTASDAHPLKLDDFRRPQMSLSEP